MQLKDYLKKFTFEQVYEELELMLEDAESSKEIFRHAYDMMLSLQTIPSKKTIHYQIIDDPDSDDCFSGAPDSCFNTTWEVILDKEVIVDEDCDLTELELLTNAFLCTIFMGRCPRAFLPEKRMLL